jgi:hypothetical protein
MIVVSEQEPMNPSGRLCEMIKWPPPFSNVMTSVVNPASFQSVCASWSLVPMKLGTSHWSGVGVGVGVGGVGVGVAVAVGVAVGVGFAPAL